MLLLVNISHADITLNFHSTSLTEALSMGDFTYSSLINSKYALRGKLNKSKICRNGILKTENTTFSISIYFSAYRTQEKTVWTH